MSDKIYSCGVDVGSRTTKAIILDLERNVRGRGFNMTGAKPTRAAELAIREALLAAGISGDDLADIVSTGYGRKLIHGIDNQYTTVTCTAAGAHHIFPNTVNVLNVGAVRSSAIRLTPEGQVHRFRFNDRCSSGIGRFLESIADMLEIPLEEIGQLALFSRNPLPVPGVCMVLAESEILNHIAFDQKPSDILRGVYESLALKLVSLLKHVWIPDGEITMTGGVAKNAGMVRAIEDVLGMQLNIDHDAEFIGAIGAALLGFDPAMVENIEETAA